MASSDSTTGQGTRCETGSVEGNDVGMIGT
jgi:hypothetical protein